MKKKQVALSSVFASLFLTLVKLIVGLLTGSIGILSEAAHSLLDFFAALLTYFAVTIGDKPADKSHPYGHGKVESVSALIETGLLFITSIFIVYEALKRLLGEKVEVEVAWYSFAVIIFAIIVDFSRSRALSKVAKETKSQALEADALHFSSDILSSLVVLLGLIFVAFGIKGADAVAAIGVSLFVLHAGYVLGKRTIDVLMDAAPVGLTEKITEITKKIKGVIDVEKIRVRPVGPSVFVDIVVTVSRKLPLLKVQEICGDIEKNIHAEIPETDITLRAKPLSLDNETIAERVQMIASNHNLSVHDIVFHTQNNKKYLSFDLEVDSNLDINKAHKIASHLEGSIKKELGEDLEINTHIEPVQSETVSGKNISLKEENIIKKIVNDLIAPYKSIKNVHDLQIAKIGDEFFLTLHFSLTPKTSLEEAHNLASRLEQVIKAKLPKVRKVVIHEEPLEEELNN